MDSSEQRQATTGAVNATTHHEATLCCCERIAELEAENERLRELPDTILSKLNQPGRRGVHVYTKRGHASDCGACVLRHWLRAALAPDTKAAKEEGT